MTAASNSTARKRLAESAAGGCFCPPCPGRGNDGHGMTHCAECCFGTGVEVDIACAIHGDSSLWLTARIEQARAEGAAEVVARIEALADWLETERDSIRAAYIGHNAGRAADRPVKRPDLSTWANAYEVAARHLRAALRGTR